MADYKKTLHLPKTSFPMKANLTQKENETLKFWEKIRAYETMTQANKDGERYVLHDGPPYANGHLHLGTALNKILKDIINKHKSMQGYLAEYVPGWDCHGLPIEHNVEQELKSKGKTDLPVLTVRRICRKYAEKFVDIQRKEFKRLGVFGVWEDPYLTMRPAYEAATARELGNFMAKGSVYRGKKPIYWCGSCKTALAEAEVEYADVTSPSIFVRFPLKGEGLKKVFPDADPKKTFIVIWTTTPWTLPANLAVAVHPDFEYARVRVGDESYILAKELLEPCQEKFGWESAEVTALVPGKALEGLVARHPFYNRESKVVLADYVTLETGTGCVHTAPGHGREDYETGLRYGLEVLSPLDDTGSFLPDVEFFGGLGVFQADPKVMDKLEETGNLLAREKIRHSYPHCWRCKKPVIFRATTQWFISMEANGLREKALGSIESEVAWVPAWGRERIHNMIATRPDWCISRQRNWGVPIIALLCEKCGEAYFDPDWVQSIVDKFEAHETGCDYWFEADLSEITPKDLACPKCGANQWKKENDILDVWFDSGTSFAAVVEQRKECRFPADLYLEGSDQHRGWFHSSLLASIGTRGQAPYKTVLTHGYVVDGQGKKMSKSVGNVVAPQEVIDKYGAEILRVWTASVDYQDDVRISDEIVRRLVDAYRRIRNTCRFILGNLNDFNPKEHATSPEETLVLDRYALEIAQKTHQRIQDAYDKFEFHKVFHTLHNFCVTDLSAFYLDIIKDRLYVEAKNSTKRRSAQTGLWLILMTLLQDMAPILSFTAEEVYQHLPEVLKPSAASVFGLRLGLDPAYLPTKEQRRTFELARNVRSEVNKAIEPVRQSGKIGHSLDTHVTLYAKDELLNELTAHDLDLKEMLIVSKISLRALSDAPDGIFTSEEVDGLKVEVGPTPGSKCERCWIYTEEPGTDPGHPTLCPRCAGVMAIND